MILLVKPKNKCREDAKKVTVMNLLRDITVMGSEAVISGDLSLRDEEKTAHILFPSSPQFPWQLEADREVPECLSTTHKPNLSYLLSLSLQPPPADPGSWSPQMTVTEANNMPEQTKSA